MPLYRIDYRLKGMDSVSTMVYEASDMSGVLHRLYCELYPDDLGDLLVIYRIPDKEVG